MGAIKKVEFTQAVLLGFSRTLKGGNARFASNLTQTLCERLKIVDLPDPLGEAKATETELAATSMTFHSTSDKLADYEITVNIQRVHHFELIRMDVPNSRSKAKRTELRFQVSFVDTNACAFLEEYMTKAGDSKGTLTVSYNEQPVQGDLLGEKPDETQRKLEAND